MNHTTPVPINADQRRSNSSPLAGKRSVAQQRGLKGLALLTTLILLSSTCPAGTPATLPGVFNGAPPSYGLDFVTITHAGNRDMLDKERVNHSQNVAPAAVNLGGVGYEYRIARTEVSNTQWAAFLNVAWPVINEIGLVAFDAGVTGVGVVVTGSPSSPTFVPMVGRERQASTSNWRVAAIYCNYLHNGVPTGPNINLDVFRRGSYDTSTFNNPPPGGQRTDQITRSEGALFWIPTLDEWTKSVFYDPNRYGPEQEGYWRFPYGENPPIYGPAGSPNAQMGPSANFTQPDIGSFSNALTPWGLLDAAGSVSEWTETMTSPSDPFGLRRRFVRGSTWDGDSSFDANDFVFNSSNPLGIQGLRLASAVPSPGGTTVLILCASALSRRGRRRCVM